MCNIAPLRAGPSSTIVNDTVQTRPHPCLRSGERAHRPKAERRAGWLVAAVLALTIAGCGGGPAPAGEPSPARGTGSIHAVVHPESGPSRALVVEYAAAGLGSLAATPDDEGSLVLVAVFRDGRVDETLDLETLSISVPLSELPDGEGSLDVIVDGAVLAVLLEGAAGAESRVLSPEVVAGSLHLRYDAPPRPGITLRGDFSLVIPTGESTLKLEGAFEVPVLGS